jgi:hypothetical protein
MPRIALHDLAALAARALVAAVGLAFPACALAGESAR